MNQSKGMALIAVLWITSLLALMAAGIGSSSRTSAKLAFNRVENAKARMLADAGVQQAIMHLLINETNQPWQAGGKLRHAFNLGDGHVRVEVSDEDGKIDVNTATLPLLQGLFAAVGLDQEQAASLASRVGDYRDEDSGPRPSGAEDADYEAAGLTKGAADRPFRRIEELADVLGITDAIYQRVQPHMTIYSDAEGIDPLRASVTVLRAIPGITPEAEAALLSMTGANGDVLDLDYTLLEPIEDYILPSRELIFSVRAVAKTQGGGRFVREAVIALDGGRQSLPFTTYAWKSGTLRSGD